MKSKYFIIGVIILVIIVGIIFIINPFEQEAGTEGEKGTEEIGQLSFGEPDAKWVFEGLRISGKIVDHEVFELPDGNYALHKPLDTIAYSPDGLTWTMSKDKAIGEGSSILRLLNGGYKAWWSVCAEGVCDIMTAFSSDGYNWGDEIKLTSGSLENPYGTLPFVVMLPDETYRIYYARSSSETHLTAITETINLEIPIYSIYSAHSLDGLVWEEDPGKRIDGKYLDNGHASSGDVYIREDGKYEMVYCSGWGDLAWAVSDDGLSWTHMGITDFQGFDPVINVFPDGTVRIYYDNYLAIREIFLSNPERLSEFLGTTQLEDLSDLPETLDGRPVGIYSAVREPI